MIRVLFFASLFLPLTCISQADSLKTLDPVSITASMHEAPLSRTGRNVVVLSGELFKSLPVHSVDELLRYVPGVEMHMRGPLGAQSDIVLRGSTFQQTLVLLDGVRVNDPVTGHFSSYIPITPGDIDRIEVLKGASSAMYGTEAVGGVIQIISKTFAKKNNRNNPLSAQIITGEHGLFSLAASSAFSGKSYDANVGVLTNSTTGIPMRGIDGYVKNQTFTGAFAKKINSSWKLAVRAAYDKRGFAAQNYYTTFLSDTATEKVSQFWSQILLSYVKTKHEVQITAGYKTTLDQYAYNKSSVGNKNRSRLLQATVKDIYTFGKNTTIIYGAQALLKTIISNDRGNHDQSQIALFTLLQQKMGPLTMIPSLRFEKIATGDVKAIPQLNASLRISQFQVRSSIGKTVRTPDFTELYNNYNKASVSGGSIGNPWLVPETATNFDFGVDYFIGSYLKASVSYFTRNQHNVIDWATTAYSEMPRRDNLVAGRTYALASNMAKLTTSGAEFDVQFNKGNEHSAIHAGLGFTYLKDKSNQPITSFYISSHAKNIVNAYFTYEWQKHEFSVNGLYKERNTMAASAINATIKKQYTVLNGRYGYTIKKGVLKVFVEADNIFDVQYSDLLGAKMPGRWLMCGITIH